VRELLAMDGVSAPLHVQRDEAPWVKRVTGASDSDLVAHDSGDCSMRPSRVRMAATMAVTTIASLALLLRSSWWVLLALIPLGLAVLAYNAAVQAALAYAETVHVAFDLHRADLLTALRMELPSRQDTERILNEQWCDLWRQGIPLPAKLEYSTNNNENHIGQKE